jgi:hypothetical protein
VLISQIIQINKKNACTDMVFLWFSIILEKIIKNDRNSVIFLRKARFAGKICRFPLKNLRDIKR